MQVDVKKVTEFGSPLIRMRGVPRDLSPEFQEEVQIWSDVDYRTRGAATKAGHSSTSERMWAEELSSLRRVIRRDSFANAQTSYLLHNY